MRVEFKKTYYDEAEAACVRDALASADYIQKVKDRLAGDYGEVYLTTSGSSAYDILFSALNFEPDGEVITASFTFPSVGNTALRHGLVPVFAEIDRDTKALDINDVKRKITPKTCCVVTTHYAGSSADLDELKTVLGGIPLFEDAALSFGARYKGRPLGTVGDAGIFSFHRTKSLSCEQGGMLVLSRDMAAALGDKIQRVYDLGTDKADFLSGKVPEYTWRQVGLNAVMPNTSAAVLYAQLEKADDIIERQRHICRYYRERLNGLAEKYGIELPYIPSYNMDNGHVFYLLFQTLEVRERLRGRLKAAGVDAFFHYMPLHASEMGRRLGYRPADLPVTLSVSRGLLRLPVYAAMTQEECAYVAGKVGEALCT